MQPTTQHRPANRQNPVARARASGSGSRIDDHRGFPSLLLYQVSARHSALPQSDENHSLLLPAAPVPLSNLRSSAFPPLSSFPSAALVPSTPPISPEAYKEVPTRRMRAVERHISTETYLLLRCLGTRETWEHKDCPAPTHPAPEDASISAPGFYNCAFGEVARLVANKETPHIDRG